jgi:preprotein translocase subunit SecG
MLYVFITILIVLAAVLLTLIVLIQNSKGGGLANGFSSGNQVMGAPKTADFLEKATWTIMAIIVALSIIAVGYSKSHQGGANEEQSSVEVEAVAPASELPAQSAD